MELAASPDGKILASFEWGGEMGMGGPEWGTVRLSTGVVVNHAQPSAVFSADSQFLAVPVWELPAEGIDSPQAFYNSSIRIAIVKLQNGTIRHVGKHMRYPEVTISSVSEKEVEYSVDGQRTKVNVENVQWE